MNEEQKEWLKNNLKTFICVVIIGAIIFLFVFGILKSHAYKHNVAQTADCNNMEANGNTVKLVSYKQHGLSLIDCYVQTNTGNFVWIKYYRAIE